MMNLCIDIGNSRIKLYATHNTTTEMLWIGEEWTENFEELVFLTKRYNFKQGIISSTRNPNEALQNWLSQHLKKILVLNPQTNLPIEILYETPSTLGQDRKAVAVAAQYLFPNENCLIINAGTCITYDFITKEKKYLGGSIAPGLYMRFKAMHSFTDRLPLVELKETNGFIGTTTESSMITGAVEGCIAEIDGRINQYKEAFGHLRSLISGGDGLFFEKRLKNEIFAHPNLLPIGLHAILEYNL